MQNPLRAALFAVWSWQHRKLQQTVVLMLMELVLLRVMNTPNPVIGAKHELQKISETKITVSFAKHLENDRSESTFSAPHPY
jgi:hypothetical protein